MSHFDLKKEYFSTFLKDDNKNFKALGNYQEPTEFKFVNNSKKKLYITKLTILIEDNRIFKDENYGSESQLDNGITAYFTKEKIRREIIQEIPITSNKDWLCYPCSVQTETFNLGHKFLRITFNFAETNNYVVLFQHDKIAFVLNDNFTRLENHTFNIEGFYMKI
jgi:hypothetical protein